MLYQIKAVVLDMGFGERVVTKVIDALTEKDAAQKFIEKYLTIEILEVIKL